jgi:ParB family chromosome partitioning protein
MAVAAEQLLADTGWLPEPLRTRGVETVRVPVHAEAAPALAPDAEREIGVESHAEVIHPGVDHPGVDHPEQVQEVVKHELPLLTEEHGGSEQPDPQRVAAE